MKITKEVLDKFAESFNEANTNDDVEMQNRAKDGASIVFGAMNGYLWLLRKDEPADKEPEGYAYIRNAFQTVMEWFIPEWDLEEWTHVKGRGKGRTLIEVEPKEKQ